MTIEEAKRQAEEILGSAGYVHARREVEIFLSLILDQDSAWILTHEDEDIDINAQNKLRTAVEDRISGKPIAYITGEQPFLGWTFKADKRALIPRPETEQLTELTLREIHSHKLENGKYLEIGTGAGVIAISLKKYFPHADITATDVSDEALELAEENAKRLNVSVDFVESDLFEDVPEGKYDLIVANLPYVPTQKLEFVSNQILDWEPMVAIDAGDDGLKYLIPFINELPKFLTEKGIVALEFWHTHSKPVKELVNKVLPNHQVTIEKDLANFDRYAVITPK
jgi:release factor glutamine methyltransferase